MGKGKRNGYLERQEQSINAYRQAEKETYIQFMGDLISLVLNDPDYVGKDVFGKGRLVKVNEGLTHYFDLFHGALEKRHDSDVFQTHLDERLKDIYDDEFVPFRQRYDWLKYSI